MKFSDGEKLILLMLSDLHKQLKIKGEIDPEFVSHTIYNDHLWGFNWKYSGIPFEREDTPPDVKETANALDMWSVLERSYEKLGAGEKKKVDGAVGPIGVKFSGFDGNNEPHYGIALYLIEHLQRFTDFAGRNLNSHMPLVSRYNAMYAVFEPMRMTLASRLFNADEIIQILNAAS